VVARLIAGAALLIVACGGTGSAMVPPTAAPATTAPTTTSTAIAGAPDAALLSEMVAGLCETAAQLAAGQAVSARSLFYARPHDTIHQLMDAVRPAEPGLAAELEDAKNELEVRFGYLFQDDDVTAEMDGLLAALSPVLAVVGGPAIDC
jgi:hypothetical protein